MAGIEEVPRPSPEVSLGSEEARALNEAAGRLVGLIDFASDPAADQWRAGARPEETKEAGGDFLREVLALRGWRTVKEALDEQSGIRFTEDNRVNRLRVQRLTDFLERQGITEEVLEEESTPELPAAPGRELIDMLILDMLRPLSLDEIGSRDHIESIERVLRELRR